MRISVRGYRSTDHDQVVALAPHLEDGVAPWRDPDAVARAVVDWVAGSAEHHQRDGRGLFVAERDGRVVGFVSMSERTHFTGEVDAYAGELVVANGSRGSGVGRALMRAAESWGSDRGLRRLTLQTGASNIGARAFYAAPGYEEEDLTLSRRI